MRLKDLFVVPSGQKITDKYLRRVLVSSICSILLCMGCLAGTTWAWFTVSIENTDNMINIGTPEVKILVDEGEYVPEIDLAEGSHAVSIFHANEGDSFSKKSTLYVTLTVDESNFVYIILDGSNGYHKDLTLKLNTTTKLSWTVSWMAPSQADLLTGDSIVQEAIQEETPEETLTTESEEEETAETTESTEESEDSTETTETAEETEESPVF